MGMAPFYTRFRDLALNETRSVKLWGHPGIPDGEYGFLELFCSDPGCDCRRVLIQVVTSAPDLKVWATINYGWESLAFYKGWMRNAELAKEAHGASLDVLNPQTEYAPALLELFKTIIRHDKAYVERLKRHYQMFKANLANAPRSTRRSVGRTKSKRKKSRR